MFLPEIEREGRERERERESCFMSKMESILSCVG